MTLLSILGLGEAGGRYGRDLAAAGVDVLGFDPAPVPTPTGVRRCDSLAEAVESAEIVISFTGARASAIVARQACEVIPRGTLYADFNTGSPVLKREIGRIVDAAGAIAADVAVLAPVPRAGAKTPLLVSGPGADAVTEFFRDVVGAEAQSIRGEMGDAAARKLLRSVFMKGLAAVVIEADEASARVGQREWLRDQMADELGPAGRELLERLITGTRMHAERRLHEMEDAAAFLSETGAHREMTLAAVAWLDRLAGAGERS
ncbi:NAD(P)-dependent oxidoreductase [Gryllotalpicola ginsengisoli]|uniref:NAD(P)-dependent oxidoreductase n=1 Tax=Gryllotalpicola ginsengisoli TaxID=444608 RepID=UPI0003B5E40B|nr:NAD(P)-dependent oxidoreductase [Gryllotalpicola ginsengisoli]